MNTCITSLIFFVLPLLTFAQNCPVEVCSCNETSWTIRCGVNEVTKIPPFKLDHFYKTLIIGFSIGIGQSGGIGSRAFENLKALNRLQLPQDNLGAVGPGLVDDSFAGLDNLTLLDLRSNWFNSFEKAWLAPLPNLLDIFLDSNGGIGEVKADTFQGNPKLQKISLSKCNLKAFPAGLLPTVKDLKALGVSGNDLTDFPVDDLKELHLEKLDVSKNPLPCSMYHIMSKYVETVIFSNDTCTNAGVNASPSVFIMFTMVLVVASMRN